MTDTIYLRPATELIEQFKSRSLSPVELMQAVIDRAETVEPVVNAFSYAFFEEALEKARASESAYRNGTARPLEGIPVAIKDENAVEGQVTSNGSLIWENNVMSFTEPLVQRLLDAGAIIHARSAAPEFSVHYAVWSKIHGITRNPWSLNYFPGGSSGGAGAALACGTTVLANGSDLAGSTRMPASMNGVVGFKPPYGRVPHRPGANLETSWSPGPMGRSVDDCILMQNVMAGPHPADWAAIGPKLTLPSDYDGIEGMRIAYSPDLGYFEVEPDIVRNAERALDVFRDLGAIVEEVDVPWDLECERQYHNYICGVGIRMIRTLVPEGAEDLLTSYVRWFFEQADEVTMDDQPAVVQYRIHMATTLGEIFAKHDALVCPTMASVRVPADYDYSQPEHMLINGKERHPLWGATMTYPFNSINQIPVLNLPTGLADNKAPTGLQIVVPAYQDPRAFQIGKAYESALGPFVNDGNAPGLEEV